MRTTALCFALALSLGGCASAPKPTAQAAPPRAASLYERLGGKEAITLVVEKFVGKMGADKRVNGLFWNTYIPELKQLLVEQICEASGGPCKYSGRDMKATHAGMNLNEDHFAALVENLTFALDAYKVGAREKQELLGALASMKDDVLHQ